MAHLPCPVCGDPDAFMFWVDDAPPPTCPHDPTWPKRSIVGTCQFQLAKARQAADLRKLTPDAFDARGVMIEAEGARDWGNFAKAYPDRRIILG